MIKPIARVSFIALILLLATTSLFGSTTPKKSALAKRVSREDASAPCVGGSALSGWYGFMVGGGESSGGGKYLSGAINFDGNCGLTGANVNGGTNGQYGNTSVTGSYGQNADGTYTITMNLANQTTPQTYVVGVSESGNKARGIESDNTAGATIDIQSQLTTLTQGYTTSSLTGSYAVSCVGAGVDLNYVTFDGNGNLSGVNPYDIGGSVGNSPYSGTYSVNTDGTFTGSLVGSYSNFSFTGVIDDGVSEIKYTYNQSGNPVVGCTGKQSTTTNLQGWYGVVIGGTATPGAQGTYLSGAVFFDGNGNLNGANMNGGLNGQYGNTSVAGTYVTNADNTVTITMNLANPPSQQTYIVAVGAAGNQANGIETDGTAIATIDIQSQLQVPAVPYSVASLNGTYAAKCFGAEVDLNYVTFDGNGNLVGIDPFNNGNFGSSPYTGFYSVNPDGTFSGGFGGSYQLYTMTGVIDNATGEIEYTYDYSGVGGVVQCIGESTYSPVGTNPVAATPTFNAAPGAYNSQQSVALSDTTPGAVIYYTTNGVAPTSSSSVYSTPIQVSATTTIQAIAVANGFNNSAIGAGTYFITAGLPTAATPTFSPTPGSYSSPQSVTLLDTTPGAVIYYTTNGTTPTTGSAVYGAAIPVNTTTTIQAIAVATGFSNSSTGVGTYTITQPTAAAPAFNPAPGNYSSPQSVTLSDTTPGAVIYYTTNGTTPTIGSSVYNGAIAVNTTTTIQAIAVAAGYNNSAVNGGTYTITLPTAATPTFNPAPGTYTSAQSVTLSDTTPGAVIYYTTNGTTPTTGSSVYSSAITVSATETLQAIAVATNYQNSAVGGGTYTITITGGSTPVNLGAYYNVYGIGTVGTNPKSGGFDNDSYAFNSSLIGTSLSYQGLTLPLASANTLDAITSQTVPLPAGYSQLFLLGAGVNGAQKNQSVIVTYTDGTTSTFTQNFSDWASPQNYTGETTVIANTNRISPNGQTQTLTVDVFGYTFSLTAGKTAASVKLPSNRNVVFLAIGLGNPKPTAAAPTFSPAPGTYTSSVTVTLSDTTPGAVIYYTTNGTTPTTSSTKYTGPGTITTTTTVEAIAVAPGYNNSAVSTGVYKIVYPTAATPTFSPAPGTFNAIQSVTLSDATSGAVIHYTTNGATPTASSAVYSSPITVSSTTTIQAIAVATGYNNSAVASGVFTITGTPITPYIQVNNGSWQQTANATVHLGANVNLGPQPISGGSWNWTGPHGYTSTSRQINNIPLSFGGNTFVATYTNPGGVKSTQTFTITETF